MFNVVSLETHLSVHLELLLLFADIIAVCPRWTSLYIVKQIV